tara:strand:+ start:105 stop:1364 length:1260 start_codon:yes stop_codon:yes gene_type:complete
MSQIMLKGLRRLAMFGGIMFSLSSSHLLAVDNNTKTEDFGSKLESATWMNEIKWHGFISQNFVATDENDFLGSSSDGSFKSNEAALNASWRAADSLQLALQGLYKQIGNANPKGGRVDYAIVDWRFLDNFTNGAGFRFGRIKNPYGFFNETRDVAVTNTSILLPESVYVDYLSQLFHSSDGAGFYGHNENEYGTLLFNVQFGRPILNNQIISTLVGNPDTEGDISKERGGFARLAYEDGAGLWRAAISYAHFTGDFSRGPTDPLYLRDGSLSIEQLLLSLELNWNSWQFVTEIQRRNTELESIYQSMAGPFDIVEKGLGYYFQAAYKFTPAWTVYLRRDEAFRFKDDRHGKEFALGNAHGTFAKDTTLGFRYSPSFEWSFAMEVHQIDGTYWLPNIENPDVAAQQRYWNMFLAQIAYRF